MFSADDSNNELKRFEESPRSFHSFSSVLSSMMQHFTCTTFCQRVFGKKKIWIFFERKKIPVNRRCLLHPHLRTHVQLNVCSLGWVIEPNTLRSVASACLSFDEPTNRWTLSPVANLKGSVGLILAKASDMRISIPLDLSSRSFIRYRFIDFSAHHSFSVTFFSPRLSSFFILLKIKTHWTPVKPTNLSYSRTYTLINLTQSYSSQSSLALRVASMMPLSVWFSCIHTVKLVFWPENPLRNLISFVSSELHTWRNLRDL